MSLMLFAALSMVQATSAEPTVPQPIAPVTAPVKEKKICKVDENESSSRLRKRVCLTEAEWEKKAAGVGANDLKNMGGR